MFRIASMTKPVIGVAVMMLVEEGKLHLNDPVARYIPEFQRHEGGRAAAGRPGAPPRGGGARRASTRVPAQRAITIKDLLTHVSGLGSGPMSTSDIEQGGPQGRRDAGRLHPAAGLAPSLEFQPGSRWAYSPGAGFETLGRVIEIASGEPSRPLLPHAHLRSAGR